MSHSQPTKIDQTRRVLVLAAAIVGSLVVVAPAAGASIATSYHLIPGGNMRGTGGVVTLCADAGGYRCTGAGYDGEANQIGGLGWAPYQYWAYGTYGPDGARHNCTTYAAYRLQENGYAYPGWTANASGWAVAAHAHGVLVNQTPAVGAIAQWNAGHVAYVQDVTTTYIVTTSDSYGGGTDEQQIPLTSPDRPDNFIHFRDVAQSDVTLATTGGSVHIFAATPTGVSSAGWDAPARTTSARVISVRRVSAVASLTLASGTVEVVTASAGGTFVTRWPTRLAAKPVTSLISVRPATAVTGAVLDGDRVVVAYATTTGVWATWWWLSSPRHLITLHLSTTTTVGLASAVDGAGELHIFTATAEGAYETLWPTSRNPRLRTVRLTTTPTATVAAVYGFGITHVFVATPTGVREIYWRTTGRASDEVVSVDATSLSVVTTVGGVIHLFSATPTGTVETYWAGSHGATKRSDLLSRTPTSSLAALISATGDFHVAMLTTRGIMESSWGPGLGPHKRVDLVRPRT